MLDRILTVGGYTLLSRLTGFMRDIMLAAILGAGPAADAFFVALRLPNHFRAIFAEGAFNAAFVPAYAHVSGQGGEKSASLFANRIFTLLFVSQLVLLILAWLFMPQAMSVLAPGFTDDAEQRQLAIELTRITFPAQMSSNPPHHRTGAALYYIVSGTGATTVADKTRIPALFDKVYAMFPRLAERRKQRAGTLSGGERQMLAMGRALMSEPRLLLLDEPSLGLAPAIVDSLYETLERLHQAGLTLLIAEQSVSLALEVADHAYVLQTGRTVLEGPAARLETDEQVQRIYLGIKDAAG